MRQKPDTSLIIRLIEPRDDPAVARIIRDVMPEFGAEGPGFAINDPEVDNMSVAYSIERAAYFVVELDGVVAGCGGVAPLLGGDGETCELRKMYFLPRLRGLGMGRQLLHRCIEIAKEFGFKRMYLETLTGMDAAKQLYRRSGFQPITAPLGRTGHFSCDSFFARDL